MRQLQAMVRHLANLVESKQQADNRLRDVLALPALVVEQLQAQANLLAEHIQQLKRAIQDHINQYPLLKQQRDLMNSIPGIGPLTAAKLIAECRALTDFED